MTTAEVLHAARALIEDESKWTKGVMCDVDGHHCALGAVAAVLYPDLVGEQAIYDRLSVEDPEAVRALAAVSGIDWTDDALRRVYRVNDGAEHHGIVLDLFDRAIALAEQS